MVQIKFLSDYADVFFFLSVYIDVFYIPKVWNLMFSL